MARDIDPGLTQTAIRRSPPAHNHGCGPWVCSCRGVDISVYGRGHGLGEAIGTRNRAHTPRSSLFFVAMDLVARCFNTCRRRRRHLEQLALRHRVLGLVVRAMRRIGNAERLSRQLAILGRGERRLWRVLPHGCTKVCTDFGGKAGALPS